MEGLLSGGQTPVEQKNIFDGVFDFTKPVVYYPVRHHSMGVTLHLEDTIARYQPDCILIEGPDNANHLLPLIADEETKPPFALYYSYKDKVHRLGEETQDYRCYYPFMECSPEYVALKEAARAGVPAYFIDLPYREILYAGKEAGEQASSDEGKSSYNDDRYLAGHKAVKRMCERAGVRNYDEFWEKYFEINGGRLTTEEYVRNLLLYCMMSRENTPAEELEADGCLARERYMAGQIEEYAKKYRRILVVTGGFHTPGLYELMQKKYEKYSVPGAGKSEEEVYLMAYSEEALDALNGYASGMPYAAFYAKVYRETKGGEENAFSGVVLAALTQIAHKLRKKDEAVSTFDEICAYRMAKDLAALRKKEQPGAFELYDAVLSNYVKGEWNLSTDAPLVQYRRFMTGDGIGTISSRADVPPIVSDFEAQCKKYRIAVGDTQEKEHVLEIFAKPAHREVSMFFHRMQFLQTNFARRVKGPNLRLKKDKRLIRETWKYKWSGEVIASLIGVSVKGGTVAKACQSKMEERLKENLRSGQAASLLAASFEMGLLNIYDGLFDRVSDIFRQEADFYEIADALDYLTMLYELQTIYGVEQSERLIFEVRLCYDKAVGLLDAICTVKEEETQKALEAVKSLYDLVHQSKYGLAEEIFFQRLAELLQKKNISPCMEGAMLGILYGSGNTDKGNVLRTAGGYMQGTYEKMLLTASFLRGLFYTAKDLVFDGKYFVEMVDELLRKTEEEEFVRLLPKLRLAFSAFRPDETDRIAGQAAALYGKNAKDIRMKRAVPSQMFAYASAIDREVAAYFKTERDEAAPAAKKGE